MATTLINGVYHTSFRDVGGGGADPNAVHFNEAQSLTAAQKAQALENIGAGTSDFSGDYNDLTNKPGLIPRLYFDTFGNALPTSKADGTLKVKVTYQSSSDNFACYGTIKVQGNSSTAYAKKNWTLKLYQDFDCTVKLKHDFGWGAQSKYTLKADWIDLSHARNVVSARLWGDVVASRSDIESLPSRLLTSPNYGAIDGFVVKGYFNGYYYGRYDITIPKDEWMTNMDADSTSDVILCGEDYNSACFRTTWGGVNENGWSDELRDTTTTEVRNQLNAFITFVRDSSDADFVANFANYADLTSFIDYYIFHYFICGLDALGKNQILLSYDGGKYYASSYDMDSTFGLYWNGSSFVSTEYRCQEDYETGVHATAGTGYTNLLYERISLLFANEVSSRYQVLRNGPLSLENIIGRFESFMGPMSKELIEEDYATTTGGGNFTGIPSKTTNNLQQIRNYIAARAVYVDSAIIVIPLTSISINGDDTIEGTEGTYTVTYTPTNASHQNVTWSITRGSEYASINPSTGVVTLTNLADNSSVTITATSIEYPSISASKTITVTYSVDNPLTALTINGDDTVTGVSATYTVTYTPSNTEDTGVTWSIVSGASYASIDSATGVLTINSNANNSSVTIAATSTTYPSIIATKDITVTYLSESAISAIDIVGDNIVEGLWTTYTVTYTPSNTEETGVTWSIVSGSEYATIDAVTGYLTVLNGASGSSVTIMATSTVNSSITATKNITVTYNNIIYSVSNVTFDGTTSPINTGINLWAIDYWEMTLTATFGTQTASLATFAACMDEADNPYQGFTLRCADTGLLVEYKLNGTSRLVQDKTQPYDTTNGFTFVIRREGNLLIITMPNGRVTCSDLPTSMTYAGPLTLGDAYNYKTGAFLGRTFIGTIVDCTIVGIAEEQEDIILPAGYTRVSCIKSTASGGQYIDLNLNMYETSPTSVSVELSAWAIGIGKDSHRQAVLFGANSEVSPYPGHLIRKFISGNDRLECSFNDTTYSTGTQVKIIASVLGYTETHNVSTTLFCGYAADGTTPQRFMEAKIYYCKIKNNSNDYVRNLWPCLNPLGVAGLYDLVNNVFYPSLGDEPFIYEP